MELLPADLPVTVLPAMPIGKSNEHIAYPGTLTLSAETLIRLWTEIGESVARAGCAQARAVQQPWWPAADRRYRRARAARALRHVRGDLQHLCLWPAARPVSRLRAQAWHPRRIGRNLDHDAPLPDLVRREHLANFRPSSLDMESEYEILTPEGRVGFGWETQDLSMPGACGNALDADAERGQQLVEHSAARFVKLLDEVHRYPLTALKRGPLQAK